MIIINIKQVYYRSFSKRLLHRTILLKINRSKLYRFQLQREEKFSKVSPPTKFIFFPEESAETSFSSEIFHLVVNVNEGNETAKECINDYVGDAILGGLCMVEFRDTPLRQSWAAENGRGTKRSSSIRTQTSGNFQPRKREREREREREISTMHDDGSLEYDSGISSRKTRGNYMGTINSQLDEKMFFPGRKEPPSIFFENFV